MGTLGENTLVIIPTYNELGNLPLIVGRVRAAVPAAEVLIVDDASPDGTGEHADRMAAEDPALHVLHRAGKEGLCAAYVAGFRWGLEHGHEVLCEMDADGSHAPEQLPSLLEQIDAGADLVIGSRYVPGGKTVNWPWHRHLLSRLGNLYIGLALGGGIRDMTAGYRAYRRELVEALDLDALSGAGYIFQVDIARRAIRRDFDVCEVPITFTEREIGESKLSGGFIGASLVEVTRWGLGHRLDQAREIAAVSLGMINRGWGRRLREADSGD